LPPCLACLSCLDPCDIHRIYYRGDAIDMPLNRRQLLGSAVAVQAMESMCHGADGPIVIDRLDHLVLTVRSIAETCEFYRKALGMDVVEFGAGRKALRFGQSKINLHEAGREIEPKAERPTPGSADLCFITRAPLDTVVKHLHTCGIRVLIGPSERTGALGPIQSVYFRDPDMNLIEVSNYA
jgi:catechol 2,3-dioxygenase-like lactoylglutathione lyase family enzyme